MTSLSQVIIRLHLIFFLLFVIVGCASSPVKDSVTSTKGLLWKIDKPGYPTSYLLGTIHSEDPRVIDIPEPIKQALDRSHSLALEIEFSPDSAKYAAASMFFSDDRTLDKYIDEDSYARVQAAMSKRGMPEQQINSMKPWAVFAMLNMPESETGVYLDILLYQMAQKKGLSTFGLETIQEQINTFDGMRMEDQVAFLHHTLANLDKFSSMLDETIEIYLSRDLNKIESLNSEFTQEMPHHLGELFTQRLLVQRNHRMVERMLPILAQGPSFVGVGALHLPGREGLIHLLREQSFEVIAVY